MDTQVVPPGGDKNNGPRWEFAEGLPLSIAIVFVSLRFYVRAWVMKKLWWDDFFLLLGLLSSVSGFGLTIAGINSGLGRHVYYLPPKQEILALKLEIITILVFVFSSTFTKISICIFLIRIFISGRVWNDQKWKRAMYIIVALIVAINLSSVVSALAALAQCKPIAKWWNSAIKGTCWSIGSRLAIIYYQGGVSIFTDFLLALLPTYFLKDLQISFRTKLLICGLMSLGVLTRICAIIRTALSTQTYLSDITYSSKNFHILVELEINVAIIAAAIPALRPLWAKSANQTQKNGGQVLRANNKQRLSSAYVKTNQQIEADSLSSRLETRITAQGGENEGDVESEATSLPDCNAVMKTSNITTENLRKCEGKWTPKHSSLSDEERRVEDAV